MYDDSLTNILAAQSLTNSIYKHPKDKWLIRCSPKRETPFVISYLKPKNESSPDDMEISVSHQRIQFNPATRQLRFQNLITKEVFNSDSINYLTNIIQREYKYGEGLINTKLLILTNSDNVNNLTFYEDIRT